MKLDPHKTGPAPRSATGKPVVHLSITLRPEMLEKLDANRGILSRSQLVDLLVEKWTPQNPSIY